MQCGKHELGLRNTTELAAMEPAEAWNAKVDSESSSFLHALCVRLLNCRSSSTGHPRLDKGLHLRKPETFSERYSW